jgi:hypothetical protein
MNKEKENRIDQIISEVKNKKISAYLIAQNTKLTEAGVGKVLNKFSKNPRDLTVDAIYAYLFLNKKQNENEKEKEKEIIINEKRGKVPYFDIDVTSHITHSFNDVHETPSFYVDYKPFNDCAAYVNNYGDSMFPKYKNGERLAVKQIFNLDVINWGETYLIITNENANDLKTVKDIHPHRDLDKIILRASNPAYAGDTIINKEDVLSLFAIKGKISQNFI